MTDMLADFAAGVWDLRWPIGGALTLWALAWALERFLRARRELQAARAENARLHDQVRLLGGITRGLAKTVSSQDTPAPWIPSQPDRSDR